MLFAGDIGGTNVRLALFHHQVSPICFDIIEQYNSNDFDHLENIIRTFRKAHSERITGAVLGVAGPVLDGQARITNQPWIVQEKAISDILETPNVRLVNDLYALAASLPNLSTQQLDILHKAIPRGHSRVVLAPGTGLGQAFWLESDAGPFIIPSEGGHAAFAPHNELEGDLLNYLRSSYDHVSYERVLSGPGLLNIYNFLRDTGREIEPRALKQRLAKNDPGKSITECALKEEYPICVEVVKIFASVLGTQASNLVLTTMATAGCYLAGGISNTIAPMLNRTPLIQSYLHKGRMSGLVKQIPLMLILDERSPLYGAAHLAQWLFMK
ncbi:glucokinase [bacterium]|nr:glucokinase [bacterium]